MTKKNINTNWVTSDTTRSYVLFNPIEGLGLKKSLLHRHQWLTQTFTCARNILQAKPSLVPCVPRIVAFINKYIEPIIFSLLWLCVTAQVAKNFQKKLRHNHLSGAWGRAFSPMPAHILPHLLIRWVVLRMIKKKLFH